jgi:hypothetical protein
VKELFAADDLEWVSFGHPIRTFSFQSKAQRPHLTGRVVASLTLNRERRAWLCLYPMRRARYPEAAQADFSAAVLPRLRDWLHEKRRQPETAILGHNETLVEWTGGSHRHHELKPFL